MAKKSEPRVMDVSKPGRSKPSQTSRPIIVGHGPMAKDPTVVDDKLDNEPTAVPGEKPEITTAVSHKKITPLSDDEKPAEDDESKDEEAKDEKDEPAAKPDEDDAEAKKSEDKEDKDEKSDSDASDSGAVDAIAEQAETKKQADKEAEAAIAKQQENQKLIETKKYFVPIGHDSTKKGGSQKALIVLLVLIVLAAGAYLAVDAGVVKVNGFEVPYHIVGNK